MSEEDIVLIEETLPYIELQLDDFSSVFPDAFEGAYIFFFSFLNKKADVVKENIPEAVNETDYSLQYAAYDVRYFVNSENVVKCINIGNVDVYVEEINEIVKTGAMKNVDCYYFRIKDYTVVWDMKAKEMTFIADENNIEKSLAIDLR
mgnify:FL=1